MEKNLLNANLLKKYHQDLVYNYSEYPTKDNWSYKFKSEEYKKSLRVWIQKNKDAWDHSPKKESEKNKDFSGFI